MEFVNIAAYRFVELVDPHTCRASLLECGTVLGLRGTVLLSREGINLMLCGVRESIEVMKTSIDRYPALSGMEYKESLSGFMPFDRMKVCVREEIISMGHDDIRPGEFTGPRIAPETLRHWRGECFVFDQRVGLTPDLQPTRTRLCATCKSPLATDVNCPQCGPNGRATGTVRENLSVR